jgi:hypothetical protein
MMKVINRIDRFDIIFWAIIVILIAISVYVFTPSSSYSGSINYLNNNCGRVFHVENDNKLIYDDYYQADSKMEIKCIKRLSKKYDVEIYE